MSEPIKCSRCDGKGWTGPVHVNMGDGKHEWRERMDCYQCNGAGKISAQQMIAILEGEGHRRARVGRHESLATCSKRLGIGAAALCDYEHGRTFAKGYEKARAAINPLRQGQ